jgi:hypothetical protein
MLNFKNGATTIKSNTAVTNLNVWRILTFQWATDNMEYTPLNWLRQKE